MFKTLISLLLLMSLVIPNHSVAQFCKWVDEDGVTHYAETCPEEVESNKVQIETPPSQDQIEAANMRSKLSGEEIDARKKEMKILKTEREVSEQRSQRVTEIVEQSGYVSVKDYDTDCSVLLAKSSWKDLDRLCEEAREKRLKPEREELINRCKSSKDNDPDWCERVWLDYGAGGRTPAGYRPNKYDWLPECVTARKCQQYAK